MIIRFSLLHHTIPDNTLTMTIARDGVVSVTVQEQTNATQVVVEELVDMSGTARLIARRSALLSKAVSTSESMLQKLTQL
ncbi:MAG: hypothetical protein GPOALKHO_001850 [Sodalis sp.]|nr:MAG: hypothetical protein GPOALKHO_001850 [Sodalis sp.]